MSAENNTTDTQSGESGSKVLIRWIAIGIGVLAGVVLLAAVIGNCLTLGQVAPDFGRATTNITETTSGESQESTHNVSLLGLGENTDFVEVRVKENRGYEYEGNYKNRVVSKKSHSCLNIFAEEPDSVYMLTESDQPTTDRRIMDAPGQYVEISGVEKDNMVYIIIYTHTGISSIARSYAITGN